jgi:hypothetical protein
MPLTYTVRESLKAKHVSLKISTSGSLEVIVPHGFDQNRIPAILEKKHQWIDRVTQKVEAQQAALGLEASDGLPEQIVLRAIAEEWQVQLRVAAQFAIRAIEQPGRSLVLQGAIDHQAACRAVLQRWICYKARVHLVPWLKQVSQELNLPCDRVTIRQQKTLWGSCSAQKAISLNAKLLFLPKPLVRYVFVHELCHTVHLNHSDAFWNLISEYEPDCRRLDRQLREARYCVPQWMERDE